MGTIMPTSGRAIVTLQPLETQFWRLDWHCRWRILTLFDPPVFISCLLCCSWVVLGRCRCLGWSCSTLVGFGWFWLKNLWALLQRWRTERTRISQHQSSVYRSQFKFSSYFTQFRFQVLLDSRSKRGQGLSLADIFKIAGFNLNFRVTLATKHKLMDAAAPWLKDNVVRHPNAGVSTESSTPYIINKPALRTDLDIGFWRSIVLD